MVQDLYILMITAAVVSILFKLLKQPVVLGYIVAGVLVGPHLFGETLVNEANVKAWGDIGVLFVLFCIGLEFRLKNSWDGMLTLTWSTRCFWRACFVCQAPLL